MAGSRSEAETGGRDALAGTGGSGGEAGTAGSAHAPTETAGNGGDGEGPSEGAGAGNGGAANAGSGTAGQGGEAGGAARAGASGAGEAGSGGEEPLPLPETVTLHPACGIDEDLGGFKLVTDEEVELTTLSGSVKNGVDPGGISVLELENGDCRLLRRPRYFCDPPCSSGQACGSDGECVEMARAQDLGTIRVDGLVEPLRMEPRQPGNLYSAELDYPGIAPGTLVRLTTTVGYAGASEAFGFGVDPLELMTGRLLLSAGRDLSVRWIPPEIEARSGIAFDMSVDQHGTTPLRLHCETEDDGELVIPAEVIDALLEGGLTGFPSAVLDRRTVDSVTFDDGCMNFTVSSFRKPDIAVSGYTPCSSQDQCPSGETCNLALERCE